MSSGIVEYQCDRRCGFVRNKPVWHSRSCLIRRLLLTRYPDGVIPHGLQGRIAEELGISAARVSAVVKELDMVIVCSGGRVYGYKDG